MYQFDGATGAYLDKLVNLGGAFGLAIGPGGNLYLSQQGFGAVAVFDRSDGSTTTLVDGLATPWMITFTPVQQVTVTAP